MLRRLKHSKIEVVVPKEEEEDLNSQILCSLPLTPQPPSPTNRELYYSQLDRHLQEI
jgi:hypothetical protein